MGNHAGSPKFNLINSSFVALVNSEDPSFIQLLISSGCVHAKVDLLCKIHNYLGINSLLSWS